MPEPLHLIDLGCRDFLEVRDRQRALVAQRRADAIPDTLLLCSHPPVVTAGRSTTPEELAAAPLLAQAGLPLHRCERGGRLTFHGPGQVIGYPILRLDGQERDLHAYLRRLEAVLLRALEEMGIAGRRHPEQAGVWVGAAKIASIGVAVRGWVTWHGFALNLTGDLAPFSLFPPCGIKGLEVTSIAEMTPAGGTREDVQARIADHLCREFGRQGLWVPA